MCKDQNLYADKIAEIAKMQKLFLICGKYYIKG